MEKNPSPSDQHDPDNPQVLFSWEAPLRPYIKRSPQIIRFYLALTLIVSLIVFFFGDKILIIPLLTLLFIFYVFTVTPPSKVLHRITKFGLETAGANLRYEDLDHFYFSERLGYQILTVVTHPPASYHAYMVIPSDNIKLKVIELLTKRIVYRQHLPKTFTDKVIDWFSKLIPNEEKDEKGYVRNHTPLGL